MRGINTVEQLADVKAVPVEAVPRNGHAVLNADEPLVRAMRRRCSGEVVWFSMEPKGSEVRDFIDVHCRRGGKAVVLEKSEKGDMIVVKHGPREMQLAWTHLLPATFGGRALMNVQNSLAAAAAAFAAGAPLHDIRQGLRTFSTNYYLSPGRLNEIEVEGVNVVIDYCHNAPGMRMLGDFVDKVGEGLVAATSDLAKPSRIGVIATAGDRRDEDMVELGDDRGRPLRRDRRTRGRRAARPRARRDLRAGRAGRRASASPTVRAASRSRSCSTRSRPPGTRWPGPTPATWSSSASTSTPPCSPSSSRGRTAPRPAPAPATTTTRSETPTSPDPLPASNLHLPRVELAVRARRTSAVDVRRCGPTVDSVDPSPTALATSPVVRFDAPLVQVQLGGRMKGMWRLTSL